mmetsp:Transcript_13661/g.25703  ORF Transcript_13661/g.25703 Transcript_13661/m.25703 type:complete len:362 (+) Transcript_13661:150-1235(+)
MSHYPGSHYHYQQDGSNPYGSVTTRTSGRSRPSTPQRQQQLPMTPQHAPPLGTYNTHSRSPTPHRHMQGDYQRRIPPRRHYPSDANQEGHQWNSTRPDHSTIKKECNQQHLTSRYYSPHSVTNSRIQSTGNKSHVSTSQKMASHNQASANERSGTHGLEQRRSAAYSSPYLQFSESWRQVEKLRQEHRDDEIQLQLMRERESEIADINQKVYKVNEIYKDLAELINGQQDLIDKIDISLEESNGYTQAGINNYEEARLRFENPIMEDPFGDKLGNSSKDGRRGSLGVEYDGRKKSRGARNAVKIPRTRNGDQEQFDCSVPFETIQDDLKEVLRDVKSIGSKIVLACTAPNVQQYNEYATYR